LPVPLAPLTIVSQFVLLVAVHAHAENVVTETGGPVPPTAPIETLAGATE
jgi:hypothetical protein